MASEQEDIKAADLIVEDLKALIEQEKAENMPGEEADIRELEEAVAHVEAFIAAENKESIIEQSSTEPMEKSVVNTDVLTGPISGLRNFLIKKSRINEMK